MAVLRRPLPRRALFPCALAASGIIGSILGLRAVFCTPFSAGLPALRSSSARLTRHAAEGDAPASGYVIVVVEKPDGESMQVEARPADQVRVLKAMIQLETGIDEDKQELCIAAESGDTRLDDDALLADSGIEEGTKLILKVAEAKDEEEEEEEVIPEGSVRIYVKCDVAPGKVKRIPLYVMPTDLVQDVKLRAYDELRKENPALGDLPVRHYGLFQLQGEVMDEIGNLRWLKRDERWGDKLPISDFSPEGDEELILANLFWQGAC